MSNLRLSTYCVACALSAVLILAGCAAGKQTIEEKTSTWSPARIYAEARDNDKSGAFDKAIPLYETLEGRAAGTMLAQQAQLDKAYSQYRNEDKPAAIATLNRFIQQHPSSPALDYALYLKGIVNFNYNLGFLSFLSTQDLSERDQKAAKEAFESFKELVSRFPDSIYAADASARMRYTINALALYDVHVANYYFKRQAYVAALNRAQQAVADFRDAPAIEQALFIMVQCYDKLGMAGPRDDAKRVLQKNFPNSQYLASDYAPESKPWWRLW